MNKVVQQQSHPLVDLLPRRMSGKNKRLKQARSETINKLSVMTAEVVEVAVAAEVAEVATGPRKGTISASARTETVLGIERTTSKVITRLVQIGSMSTTR